MEEQQELVANTAKEAVTPRNFPDLLVTNDLRGECQSCFEAFTTCVQEARRIASLNDTGVYTKTFLRPLATSLDDSRLRFDIWIADCTELKGESPELPTANDDSDLHKALKLTFERLYQQLKLAFAEINKKGREQSSEESKKTGDDAAAAVHQANVFLHDLIQMLPTIQMFHAVKHGRDQAIRDLIDAERVAESETQDASSTYSEKEECEFCHEKFSWAILPDHQDTCSERHKTATLHDNHRGSEMTTDLTGPETRDFTPVLGPISNPNLDTLPTYTKVNTSESETVRTPEQTSPRREDNLYNFAYKKERHRNELTRKVDEPEWEDFRWLGRAYRGPAYTSYSQYADMPYCSFEWGENGFAGCSNHGGELLCLSRPSKTKGLIIARGHFSTSLDTSLSRSQNDIRRRSTFGLEITRFPYAYDADGEVLTREEMLGREPSKQRSGSINGSSFALGCMIDRGCFNYRWPVTEYYLDLNRGQVLIETAKREKRAAIRGELGTVFDASSQKPNFSATEMSNNPTEKSILQQRAQRLRFAHNGQREEYKQKEEEEDLPQARHVGTCQMLSCAMDDIFYQVLRIEELQDDGEFHVAFPADSQIVLTMGGPVWFHSFKDDGHDLTPGPGFMNIGRSFQQSNSAESTFEHDETPEEVLDKSEKNAQGATRTIIYWDKNKDRGGRGLQAQIFQIIDGKATQLVLIGSKWEAENGVMLDGGGASLTAYNAIVKIPSADPAFGRPTRSATFLARVRLFEEDSEGRSTWPELPTSKKLFHHVGVDPSVGHATGAMWERIFLDNRLYRHGTEPVIDLAEFNLIGRSLEKILQVDIMPATFHDDDEDDDEAGAKYSALISHVFVTENIDLQALFWKVRFLIRVHKFLSHMSETPPGKGKMAVSIEEFQVKRIKDFVEDVVRYLAKAMLEPVLPGLGTRGSPIMPDDHVPGASNYYYVMMTLWYVWKYFRAADPDYAFDWQGERAKQKNKHRPPTLLSPGCLPSDNYTFVTADRETVQLLQWFHYGSLYELCEHGVLDESWRDRDLSLKVSRLANAAKRMALVKLSSRVPYIADDEMFDRLSFLLDELKLEDISSIKNSAITSFSIKRIKEREYTRTLRPGWIGPDVEESTSGPWEIYALCHHSRLVVLLNEEETGQLWRTREHTHTEAEVFRRNISTFFNAEGTVVPSWERAYANYRNGWLCSEASSVIATTLIIILDKTALLAGEDVARDIQRVLTNESTPAQFERSTASPPWPAVDEPLAKLVQSSQTRDEHARQDQKKLLQEVIHLGGLIRGQIDVLERFTSEPGVQSPIKWHSYRLLQNYHPLNFFNSLGNTPELYKHDELSKRSVPASLYNEIDSPELLGKMRKDFGMRDLQEVVVLGLLSVFDIKATKKYKRIDDGFAGEVQSYKSDISWRRTAEQLRSSRNALVWALYDSLVDQEVQHRFLIVKPLRAKIPKKILELLIYVLHPESATCLDNHIRGILKFTHFSCQASDTWIVSIALRSWQVRSVKEFQNSRDDFRLPENLRPVWEKLKRLGVDDRTIFQPEASSIMLSTNNFGDFSQCTVVSEFMDHKKMGHIATEARKLWQKFVHQPQTGRCLVFFFILGKVCEEITGHYKLAIMRLSYIMSLDNMSTNKDDIYSHEYELGLWSLEALQKLQSSLNATVSSVMKTKTELMTQIIEGPGKRNTRLEQMCQEYLTEFENNISGLIAVNFQLNQTIDLSTRNREKASAVMRMGDSRIALSLNTTLKRLTYLSIVYFPIGLIAIIFSIPASQNVLYKNMGRGWFVGAVFIMSAWTYILVLSINRIIGFLHYLSVSWKLNLPFFQKYHLVDPRGKAGDIKMIKFLEPSEKKEIKAEATEERKEAKRDKLGAAEMGEGKLAFSAQLPKLKRRSTTVMLEEGKSGEKYSWDIGERI